MVSADISTYRLLLAIFHYKFYRSYFPLRIYKYKESGNRSYRIRRQPIPNRHKLPQRSRAPRGKVRIDNHHRSKSPRIDIGRHSQRLRSLAPCIAVIYRNIYRIGYPGSLAPPDHNPRCVLRRYPVLTGRKSKIREQNGPSHGYRALYRAQAPPSYPHIRTGQIIIGHSSAPP